MSLRNNPNVTLKKIRDIKPGDIIVFAICGPWLVISASNKKISPTLTILTEQHEIKKTTFFRDSYRYVLR